MSFNLVDMFKQHSFTDRTPERQTLRVPIHERINDRESIPIITAAANQIAKSGKVWKWHCSNGTLKLVHWNDKEQAFLRGSLEDYAISFGKWFVVRDTMNVEYLGPSIVVCDRLVAAVLKHPDTPEASWSLQLQMKRENAIKGRN
jgi:hypothetical protein